MNTQIGELQITFMEDFDTVKEESSITHVLELFLDKRITAVPIVDAQGNTKVLECLIFHAY